RPALAVRVHLDHDARDPDQGRPGADPVLLSGGGTVMAQHGESFARRLRRLEDGDQIPQLNLAYRRHLDPPHPDASGALFAAEGEWLGGTGYGKGPAGIAAMLRERLAGNPGPPGATSWHVVTESDISVHGDRATGTVTWALIQRGPGDTPVMRLLGHYDD